MNKECNSAECQRLFSTLEVFNSEEGLDRNGKFGSARAIKITTILNSAWKGKMAEKRAADVKIKTMFEVIARQTYIPNSSFEEVRNAAFNDSPSKRFFFDLLDGACLSAMTRVKSDRKFMSAVESEDEAKVEALVSPITPRRFNGVGGYIINATITDKKLLKMVDGWGGELDDTTIANSYVALGKLYNRMEVSRSQANMIFNYLNPLVREVADRIIARRRWLEQIPAFAPNQVLMQQLRDSGDMGWS